jgi:alkyl hydroperoxide reductase subunit AhpC
MIEIGSPAPNFTANAFFPRENAIRKLSLSELRGKWVLTPSPPRRAGVPRGSRGGVSSVTPP